MRIQLLLDSRQRKRKCFTRIGFPGRAGKERGNAVRRSYRSFRGCPRNCRRIASVQDGHWATGKVGHMRPRRASQETCRCCHPTDGRGVPYGAVFRSGDYRSGAKAARGSQVCTLVKDFAQYLMRWRRRLLVGADCRRPSGVLRRRRAVLRVGVSSNSRFVAGPSRRGRTPTDSRAA